MTDRADPPPSVRPRLFVRGGKAERMREAPLRVDWKLPCGTSAGGRESGSDPAQAAVRAELLALIDFSQLNGIFENFLEVTGLPISIIDLDARVLASSRWQRLCLDFHRANPITLAGCIQSDTELSRRMEAGSDCAIYQCVNGLTDCATPLVIEGVHVANLFTGQFLLDEPDPDFFRRQGRRCGFDEAAYSEALAEVPVVSRDRIQAILKLLRGLAQQIASQSLANAKLESTRRVLQTVIDTIPHTVFWKDAQSRYLGCNRAVARMAAVADPEDIIGKTDYDLPWRELAELYRRQDARVMATGVAEHHRLEPVHPAGGSVRWMETSKVPLRDAQGQVVGVLGMSQDITERKRTEEELAHAKEAAEHANRAKSAFLATMSHEIRTPLHVIVGLAHLLRRDLIDPVHRQRLDQLCANSDHLLALLNDVLDFSKIEADRLILDHTPFRLDALVDQVRSTLARPALEKGVALTFAVAPDLRYATVQGDPLRLAQVLLNLGGNAIKFTDRGEVRIEIDGRPEGRGRLRLRFTVRDTGIGIAPADRQRLFQPFTQGDSSPTRSRGGTGLGLAISQRLVGLMGGTIKVQSRLGKGSRFRFDIVLPRAAEVPEPAAPGCTDLGGRRILVVEDHPLAQEILFEMLEDLGCEVEVASDGAEAVACAQAYPYDLILMDMQMPRMDGLAATRAIRALPDYRSVPIIALTANAFAEDRRRCLEAGMNGHVGKPVTPAALTAALAQWLPDLDSPARGTPAPPDDPLVDALAAIPGLDASRGLRGSRLELAEYRTLLVRFIAMHGEDIARVRERLGDGELDEARTILHNLKGISGFVGAASLAARATALHAALRAGADPATLDPLVHACDAELGALAEAVRALPLPAA